MTETKPVTSGFAEIPGARLYYEMAGEGETLVLLHGGMLDTRMWDEQFQIFAQNYRVIRYDERSSGKSEDLASNEQPYIFYQDLYQLLNSLGVERASLIGLSLGSRMSIDFAIAYPERVHKLVLAAPGMSGYAFSEEVNQRGSEMEELLMQGKVAESIESFVRLWADGQRSPEQIDPAVRERVRVMAADTLARPGSEEGQPPQELEPLAIDRLTEITAPTLIIVGDQDMPDILTITKLLEEQVAGSKSVIVPGVAHMVNMEKPEEFTRLVNQIL